VVAVSLKKPKATLKSICTRDPLHGANIAQNFGFADHTTSPDDLFQDPEINILIIATRHDSHAQYVIEAAKSGKHIFVEKPLCVNPKELISISEELERQGYIRNNGDIEIERPQLIVGYNRRFSKSANILSEYFEGKNSTFMINYQINAEALPENHWTNAVEQGGRIIGEVCHFIDFMQFMTGSTPVGVYAKSIFSNHGDSYSEGNVVAHIEFSDGSLGTIHYMTSGNRKFPKEVITINSGGRTAVLTEFKNIKLFESNKVLKHNVTSGKGHKEELSEFYNSIQSGKPLISLESLFLTTLTTFCINESISTGKTVEINLTSIS